MDTVKEYTVKEVAELAGRTPMCIHRAIARGALPARRVLMTCTFTREVYLISADDAARFSAQTNTRQDKTRDTP